LFFGFLKMGLFPISLLFFESLLFFWALFLALKCRQSKKRMAAKKKRTAKERKKGEKKKKEKHTEKVLPSPMSLSPSLSPLSLFPRRRNEKNTATKTLHWDNSLTHTSQ
jgi:flagellar biosynthesis component FlhA